MRATLALILALGVLVTGCTGSESAEPTPTPSGSATIPDPTPLDSRSVPVEDRVYPEYGDPVVDALTYALHLDWSPTTRTLRAREVLDFRATDDAPVVHLALGEPLTVERARLDGRPVEVAHDGTDLVVRQRVRGGQSYRLALTYAGRPRPADAPTQRSDIDGLGWTTTADGEVWTMQEPYGAFTWYAVNDQPSDKARYQIEITAPRPMVGVANGSLGLRTTKHGETTTSWDAAAPMSSYLVTVAIGDLRETEDRSESGVPLTYWTPAGRPGLVDRLRETPDALAWLEDRLGPFPFSSLGILVVDSRSGMETQTMITLGDTAYATSPDVLVHEIAHQWYGDLVTPTDWRDVWMNEGMAMYLQAVWAAHDDPDVLRSTLAQWASDDQDLRDDAGPPADYDPDSFGATNVYTIPARMWDALRQRVGDDEFWRLVRAWPVTHAYGNAGYDDITAWWSKQTGEDLSGFFHDWLLGETTPGSDASASAVG
ncbi:M1 family metallopeptidase [Nocardioides mangrovi]|uniref:Aminopeptidase N n=1 Tax=Nocardioides mangrovi TaxID=2874580 RepID=A0ABS7UAH0_9ACTN|nr:M1 family metallopeptidase [Nocardioides mangrovi]MBZ5737974.1 M1 family metallopeptidase [Nocardioides mangrovi]